MRSDGNGGAKEEINEIKTSASQAISEVREIAYNLRPYHLGGVYHITSTRGQGTTIRIRIELYKSKGVVERGNGGRRLLKV